MTPEEQYLDYVKCLEETCQRLSSEQLNAIDYLKSVKSVLSLSDQDIEHIIMGNS